MKQSYTINIDHELKCHPEYFQAIKDEQKTFEVRKCDRVFSISDVVKLQEWNPKTESYTGRIQVMRISYVLSGVKWGIAEGYCVLGLQKIKV